MNYLAHAFLSPRNNPEILLGNLAGDSVRHIDRASLPLIIQKGLDLHLRIDRATDSNPAFKELRQHLDDAGFPYPGVVADLMIDYCLGSCWTDFAEEPFTEFKKRIYTIVESRSHLISSRFAFTAAVLVMEDWFESYRTVSGMETAFFRLNRKTRRDIPVKNIVLHLVRHQERISNWGRRIVSGVAGYIRLYPEA